MLGKISASGFIVINCSDADDVVIRTAHVLRYSEDMNIDDCWEETFGLNAGV
jgi:hypothetical protein